MRVRGDSTRRFFKQSGPSSVDLQQRESERLIRELRVEVEELTAANAFLKEEQAELRQAHDLYERLYDFSPVGDISFDTRGCLQDFNLAAMLLLGADPAAMLQRPLEDFVEPGDHPKLRRHIEHCLQGRDRVVTELRLDNGAAGSCVQLTSFPPRDRARGCSLFRATLSDVTARRTVEEREQDALRSRERELTDRLERSAAARAFTSASASEMRTLLSVAKERLSAARQGLPVDAPAAHYLDRIDKTLRALSDAVVRLEGVGVVRPDGLAASRCHAAIHHVVELLREPLRNVGITVELALNDAEMQLGLSPRDLVQVLLDLLLGARDAMPAGGTLTLTTRCRPPCCVIGMTHTGGGIPRDVREHVFQPRFQYAAARTGSPGPAVAETVRRHGGRLEGRSVQGRGEEITLHLPLADAT